jgi:predicted  nucleic acid-binding Zn-ribbon protein
MERDPEQAIEHDIDELEERIDGLEENIGEAKDLSEAEEIAGEERDEPSEEGQD